MTRSRRKNLINIGKLGEEELLTFIFTAILSDGSANIEKDSHDYDKAIIKITMSNDKFNTWKPILKS